jgi:hypothetical protein
MRSFPQFFIKVELWMFLCITSCNCLGGIYGIKTPCILEPESSKERDYLGNVGKDERATLKCNFK